MILYLEFFLNSMVTNMYIYCSPSLYTIFSGYLLTGKKKKTLPDHVIMKPFKLSQVNK